MKFITVAVIALIANIEAIQYAESEGPTKADNGEADETVLPRTIDDAGKWSNPLSWSDTGAEDESILAQLSSGHKHHKKHHHHKAAKHDFDRENQFAQAYTRTHQRKVTDQYRRQNDAYDGDSNSASPYDDMYQHKYADWGVPEGESGSKGPWGHYHGTWTSGSA